jgi:hypothetical protein
VSEHPASINDESQRHYSSSETRKTSEPSNTEGIDKSWQQFTMLQRTFYAAAEQ